MASKNFHSSKASKRLSTMPKLISLKYPIISNLFSISSMKTSLQKWKMPQ